MLEQVAGVVSADMGATEIYYITVSRGSVATVSPKLEDGEKGPTSALAPAGACFPLGSQQGDPFTLLRLHSHSIRIFTTQVPSTE